MPIFTTNSNPSDDKLSKLEEALSYIEQFLDNHTWVAGQYLTIADFAMIPTISTIEVFIEVHTFPKLY